MDFPTKMKSLRRQTGLSLLKASKETGLNVKTINRWEQGRTIPKMSNLFLYCNWLETKDIKVDRYELIHLAGGGVNPRVPTAS